MLSKEQIKKLKNKLEKTKADLEAQVKELDRAPEFGHDTDHFEEAADEVEEYSKNLGMEQTFRERLENIDHALQKMKSGNYGACEKCGKAIELKILEIDPESRLCRDCKKTLAR